MRRIPFLLAAVLAGAAPAASAQAHVGVEAHLYPDQQQGPGLSFHVVNLLSDPQWRSALDDHALPIHLFWTIQPWQSHFLQDKPGQALHWEVVITHDAFTGIYTLKEGVSGGRFKDVSFTSVDSVRASVEEWLGPPAPIVPAAAGDWYWTVDLTITQNDQVAALARAYVRPGTAPNVLTQYYQRLMLNSGLPSSTLPQVRTPTFTIRKP